jgi:hypothetical protein
MSNKPETSGREHTAVIASSLDRQQRAVDEGEKVEVVVRSKNQPYY